MEIPITEDWNIIFYCLKSSYCDTEAVDGGIDGETTRRVAAAARGSSGWWCWCWWWCFHWFGTIYGVFSRKVLWLIYLIFMNAARKRVSNNRILLPISSLFVLTSSTEPKWAHFVAREPLLARWSFARAIVVREAMGSKLWAYWKELFCDCVFVLGKIINSYLFIRWSSYGCYSINSWRDMDRCVRTHLSGAHIKNIHGAATGLTIYRQNYVALCSLFKCLPQPMMLKSRHFLRCYSQELKNKKTQIALC